MANWQIGVAVVAMVAAFLVFQKLQSRLSDEEMTQVVESLARGARIVDVRTPREFAGGHADGAINLPLSDLDRGHRKLGKKKRPIVVYCRSGNRSAKAASYLRSRGYDDIVDMKALTNWNAVQQARQAHQASL